MKKEIPATLEDRKALLTELDQLKKKFGTDKKEAADFIKQVAWNIHGSEVEAKIAVLKALIEEQEAGKILTEELDKNPTTLEARKALVARLKQLKEEYEAETRTAAQKAAWETYGAWVKAKITKVDAEIPVKKSGGEGYPLLPETSTGRRVKSEIRNRLSRNKTSSAKRTRRNCGKLKKRSKLFPW